MGRKKKSLLEKTPVKLRHRKLADGRESLFLDRSVDGRHEYEFLKLYLLPESTALIKRQNAQTLRKAEDIARERAKALLNTKVDDLSSKDNRDVLLSDWMQICIDNHKERGLRDMHSVKNARNILYIFRPDAKLTDIDRQFCLELINWLRNTYISPKTNSTLSPKTGNTYCQVFRTSLNEAVQAGVISKNPWNLIETIEKIKVPESKRDFLTIDEVRKMIATPCPNRLVKHAYLFSCFTGLRISDVRKLAWKDMTISNGQTYISVVMQKTTKPLYIPLSRQAMKWMPEANDANPESLVFKGLVYDGNVNENLKKWAAAAGITKNVCYHTSRHTFATMMLTLGADIYTVSKLLGHSSVRHTLIYAKIIDRKKDEAVSLIENVF